MRGSKYIISGAIAMFMVMSGIVAAGAGESAEPTVIWGYFQGQVASPGSVIGTQPSLKSSIPAHLNFVPINSGVVGLAGMHSGSYQVVEGVGNPPVVGALASGTKLKIVFAESYDGAGLYVNSSVISSPSQLAGQNIGDLGGSSENFELEGYLTSLGLANKVTVTPFSSDAAAAAAFAAGKLNAVYVDFGAGASISGLPNVKIITTAAKIALLGFPSINALTMETSFVNSHKNLVQKIVCAVSKASSDMTGANRTRYFAKAAKLLGEPEADAITGSKEWPELTLQDQVQWFGKPGTPVLSSKIFKVVYQRSAKFLLKEGVVTEVPSNAQIAAAIDPSFVDAALSGACG
jgi:NitT/TauT family transport system substrate-binding protein